mmetsp:Transcript_12769/g.39352  ORF Transcript_12769/g.39352 Transcript_12769/m.39352 type:complete len:308 (+) Transcript_12769:303-1226(+)
MPTMPFVKVSEMKIASLPVSACRATTGWTTSAMMSSSFSTANSIVDVWAMASLEFGVVFPYFAPSPYALPAEWYASSGSNSACIAGLSAAQAASVWANSVLFVPTGVISAVARRNENDAGSGWNEWSECHSSPKIIETPRSLTISRISGQPGRPLATMCRSTSPNRAASATCSVGVRSRWFGNVSTPRASWMTARTAETASSGHDAAPRKSQLGIRRPKPFFSLRTVAPRRSSQSYLRSYVRPVSGHAASGAPARGLAATRIAGVAGVCAVARLRRSTWVAVRIDILRSPMPESPRESQTRVFLVKL